MRVASEARMKGYSKAILAILSLTFLDGRPPKPPLRP